VTESADRAWHVGEYGALGWAETALKAAAFVCAYVAFVQALGRSLHSPNGIHIVELALIGVAELGLLAAIGDRLIERETVAMVFACLNNLAHLGVLYALLAVPGPGGLVSLFCGLMLAGEAVKLVWLEAEHVTMRGLSTLALQALVGGYALIYSAALVVWQFLR
jgi:hypothetical protein